MTGGPTLEDFERWWRYGHGLGTGISGTDPQTLLAAFAATDARRGPLRLLASGNVKREREYVATLRTIPISDGNEAVVAGQQYFIWSPALTSELVEPMGKGYAEGIPARFLSLCGLVNVYLDDARSTKSDLSNINCTYKVATDDGDFHHHVEYEQIYRHLLREIRREMRARATGGSSYSGD
jgi:hypothetical protein